MSENILRLFGHVYHLLVDVVVRRSDRVEGSIKGRNRPKSI